MKAADHAFSLGHIVAQFPGKAGAYSPGHGNRFVPAHHRVCSAAMKSAEWIQRFSRARVVVLGDLVADEYVYGETDRVSREAPVLVVRYESAETKLGGAANVAANIASLT